MVNWATAGTIFDPRVRQMFLDRQSQIARDQGISKSPMLIFRSEGGQLLSYDITTFNVTASSLKGFEARSIKNLSSLLPATNGMKNHINQFLVHWTIQTVPGATTIDSVPFIVIPYLVVLAPGSSIASPTETDQTLSIDKAMTNGITGEFQVIPLQKIFCKNIKTFVLDATPTVLYCIHEQVVIDILPFLQKWTNKTQNNPLRVDGTLHLCAIVCTPAGDGRDIIVKSQFEYEMSMKPLGTMNLL